MKIYPKLNSYLSKASLRLSQALHCINLIIILVNIQEVAIFYDFFRQRRVEYFKFIFL